MSYKSILVHVNNSRNAEQRYELAFEVVTRESARALGVAMTIVSRYLYQPSLINGTDVGMANYINTMTDFAREQATAVALSYRTDCSDQNGITHLLVYHVVRKPCPRHVASDPYPLAQIGSSQSHCVRTDPSPQLNISTDSPPEGM